MDVLAAEAAKAAGDDGDVAVEAEEGGEWVERCQEEGLPPRDLQEKRRKQAQNAPVAGQAFMN